MHVTHWNRNKRSARANECMLFIGALANRYFRPATDGRKSTIGNRYRWCVSIARAGLMKMFQRNWFRFHATATTCAPHPGILHPSAPESNTGTVLCRAVCYCRFYRTSHITRQKGLIKCDTQQPAAVAARHTNTRIRRQKPNDVTHANVCVHNIHNFV